MPLPKPIPGLVVRYAFLWGHEADQKRTEGKDRPCVVVVAAVREVDGRIRVRVAPITHAPKAEEIGIEIPRKLKRHLKLDDQDSWIALHEMNEFLWPGHDLRPISSERPGVWFYGILPEDFFDHLKGKIRAVLERRIISR